MCRVDTQTQEVFGPQRMLVTEAKKNAFGRINILVAGGWTDSCKESVLCFVHCRKKGSYPWWVGVSKQNQKSLCRMMLEPRAARELIVNEHDIRRLLAHRLQIKAC